MVNVDGWMDKQTDKETETCMPKWPMLKQVRKIVRIGNMVQIGQTMKPGLLEEFGVYNDC